MCGIAGIYHFDSAHAQRHLLERMTALIAHRGPDDAGHYCEGSIGLGHRRLSIIDLSSAGHQPMASDDRKFWIVYNGECYNYRDFIAPLSKRGHRFRSRSDTEVLLNLYQEYGAAFVNRIQGMFAFAIWDSPRRRLMLGRDRIGIKPLYYHATRSRIVFASEMKALLADPGVTGEINPAALSEYLHLMSIPGDDAIFRGVRRLSPGHYLIAENGRIKEHAYWEIPIPVHASVTDPETAKEQFRGQFARSVSSHMVSDVPVGVFLSGGVDSSAVTAEAQRHNRNSRLKSFAVSFAGYSEFDESPYARTVAQHLGTDHQEINVTPDLIDALPKVIWHADEPFAISSSFALYLLARQVRRHVKVVPTGDGGDEVFAGYPWRHVDFTETGRPPGKLGNSILRLLQPLEGPRGSRRHWLARRIAARLGLAPPRDERYLQSFSCFYDHELSELLEPDMAQSVLSAWHENVTQTYLERFPNASQLVRKLFADIKSTLVSEMLTKVDRMTMAFGLEARVPFLDHYLVEWAFTLEDQLKLQGNEGKLIVKSAMEPFLPREVLYRPKHGFNVPMRVWLRGQLREMVHELLSEERIRSRGLFRPQAVRKLIAANEHGKQDFSNRIFVMMCLELWFRTYVDGRAAFS